MILASAVVAMGALVLTAFWRIDVVESECAELKAGLKATGRYDVKPAFGPTPLLVGDAGR